MKKNKWRQSQKENVKKKEAKISQKIEGSSCKQSVNRNPAQGPCDGPITIGYAETWAFMRKVRYNQKFSAKPT